MWKEAQEQKRMPPPDVKVSLMEELCKWESEIHKILQEYLDSPKKGFLAGKKWQKGAEQPEEKRRRIHLVAVACAAVHNRRSRGATSMPTSEKPPLEDPNQMPTLNGTLYPRLPSSVFPPPYQMPSLKINHGQLEVDTDEETQDIRDTLKELQEQVRVMMQGKKKIEPEAGKKEIKQENPVVRPKIPQPFNKHICNKTTSTLRKQISQKEKIGVDPSGGFAGLSVGNNKRE